MKLRFRHKAFVLVCLLIIGILNACTCHVEAPEPLAYNYMNVPEGDTAIIDNLNIAGMGLRKNNPNTTWMVKGEVVMDHLDILGNVIIEEGGHLNVLGTLQVKEKAKLVVGNKLSYSTMKQSGIVHYPKMGAGN